MKNRIQNSILLFILSFMFTYCEPASQEESSEEIGINWQDNKAILKAAENYYLANSVKLGRASLFLTDKRQTQENQDLAPRFLVFSRADTANLHLIAREVAWLPVRMLDRNEVDTLVVDYKMIWERAKKQFEVVEIVIQKVNQEKRYEWVEDEGYWEKQLVRDTTY